MGEVKRVTAPANLIPLELHKLHKGGDERPFLTDVDIVCRGGYIPVHSTILIAGSPMLKELLAEERGTQHDPRTIYLTDYDINDVTAVIVCFYTGSTVASCREQLHTMLEIFENFGVSSDAFTNSAASEEESKKKNFVRRYLDCDDDDDLMIESDEEIPLEEAGDLMDQPIAPHDDSGPHEAEAASFASVTAAPAAAQPVEPAKTIESTAPAQDQREQQKQESKKKKPDELVKVHPALVSKVIKVNRNGVSGAKGSEEDEKDDESDAEESNVSPTRRLRGAAARDSRPSTSSSAQKRKATSESSKSHASQSKRSRATRSRASKEDEDSEFDANEEAEEEEEEEEEDDDDESMEEASNVSDLGLNSESETEKSTRRPITRRLRRSRKSKKSESDSPPIRKGLRRRRGKKVKYVIDDDEDEDEDEVASETAVKNAENNKSNAPKTSASKSSPKAVSKEAVAVTKDPPKENGDVVQENAETHQEDEVDMEDSDDSNIDVDESECLMFKELSVVLVALTDKEIAAKTRRSTNEVSKAISPRSSESERSENVTNGQENETEKGKEGVPRRTRSRSTGVGSRSSSVSASAALSRTTQEQVNVESTSGPSAPSVRSDVPPNETLEVTSAASERTRLPQQSSSQQTLTRQEIVEKSKSWKESVLQCDHPATPHSSFIDATKCLQKRGKYRCWICRGILDESVTTYTDHCAYFHPSGKPQYSRCPICEALFEINEIRSHIIQTHLASADCDYSEEPPGETQTQSEEGLIRLKPLEQLTEPDPEEGDVLVESQTQDSGSIDFASNESRNNLPAVSSSHPRRNSAAEGLFTAARPDTQQTAVVGEPDPGSIHVSAVVVAHDARDGIESVRISQTTAGITSSARSTSESGSIPTPLPSNSRAHNLPISAGTPLATFTPIQAAAPSHTATAETSHRARVESQVAVSQSRRPSNEGDGVWIADQIKNKLRLRKNPHIDPQSQLALPAAPNQPSETQRLSSPMVSQPRAQYSGIVPTPSNVVGNNPAVQAKTTTTTSVQDTTRAQTFTLSSGHAQVTPLRTPPPSNVPNAEAAVVPFQPRTRVQPSQQQRMPSVGRGYTANRGGAPGGVVVPCNAVASLPRQEGRSALFCGVTSIGGVPFKIYSRPAAAEPHPLAIATVSEVRSIANTYVIRSPQYTTRPALTYPLTNSVTMSSSNARAIQNFQSLLRENENLGSSVMPNHVQPQITNRNELENHSSQLSVPPPAATHNNSTFSSQLLESQQQSTSAPPRRDSIARSIPESFRCDKCSQQFESMDSLESHLCFADF